MRYNLSEAPGAIRAVVQPHAYRIERLRHALKQRNHLCGNRVMLEVFP